MTTKRPDLYAIERAVLEERHPQVRHALQEHVLPSLQHIRALEEALRETTELLDAYHWEGRQRGVGSRCIECGGLLRGSGDDDDCRLVAAIRRANELLEVRNG